MNFSWSNGAQTLSSFSEGAVGAVVVGFNEGAAEGAAATAMARGAQSPFSARERAGADDDPGADAEGVVNEVVNTVEVEVVTESKDFKENQF